MEMNAELENSFKEFVTTHEAQLKSCGIPSFLWNALFLKLKNEIFDAGNYFKICMRVDEDDETLGFKALSDTELKKDDNIGVFLIDHAWTYRINEARKSLRETEGLLNRMCNLMCVKLDEEAPVEERIEAVYEKMWKFNQTYKLSNALLLSDEEREPIWYIMDEFGSSIRHNDSPSVECAPFYYMPTGTMYTIMWLAKDLNVNDELTRDYVYGIKDRKLRRLKLIPWEDDYDFDEEDENGYIVVDSTVQTEPDISYFKAGRKDEILAPEAEKEDPINLEKRLKLTQYRVYTDLSSVREHLTDPKFSFVEDLKDADIIFMRKHYKDYKSLYENQPTCLINQFPFENVVTVKDLLAIVCRRVEDSNKWLPITYNLAYELDKFVSYYKQREDQDLDNHWILKPWNLARSIDTTVTNNLNQIIRSQETGPKISCKYITNPVLFYREELDAKVKYDIRYIVLLRSIQPLVIYTYKVFWLRFANKPFSLEDLDDYEKHFTVMNYRPTQLKQINCDEFVPLFEKQLPDHKWSDIEKKIFKMIRQVFEGASKENPPKGISNNYQSRAMYAVDLMLDWREESDGSKSIEPMICEVNFMPDCTRACKYHPDFFNDVFNTLFLDQINKNKVNEI